MNLLPAGPSPVSVLYLIDSEWGVLQAGAGPTLEFPVL